MLFLPGKIVLLAGKRLFCYNQWEEAKKVRVWKNMEKMGDLTYQLLSKGLLLSALLLGVGCLAILEGRWLVADTARDFSQSILLLAVLGSCYIERNR